MSPNAAEVEPLVDMNRFANGTAVTRILENMGEGTGISIHLTTFNCANMPHPRFPLALPTSAPDLIVLGLQELAPSHIAFLSLAVVENTYLKGLENVPDIVRKKYGKDYNLVNTVRVGQTALVIWTSLGQRLRKVRVAWAGCGLLGLLANKGAATARVTVANGIFLLNCTNNRRGKGLRDHIRRCSSSRSRRSFRSPQCRLSISCSESRLSRSNRDIQTPYPSILPRRSKLSSQCASSFPIGI
jgi:hypothetical protein